MTVFARCLLLIVFAAAFIKSNAQKTDSTTTIVLVRHAEKDTAAGSDPDLSGVGLKRAQALRLSLKDMVPDEFYSTAYKRTR